MRGELEMVIRDPGVGRELCEMLPGRQFQRELFLGMPAEAGRWVIAGELEIPQRPHQQIARGVDDAKAARHAETRSGYELRLWLDVVTAEDRIAGGEIGRRVDLEGPRPRHAQRLKLKGCCGLEPACLNGQS